MESAIDIIKYAHLVAKLAYDDKFRDDFSKAPEQVLKNMGIDTSNFSKDDYPLPIGRCPLADKAILQREYEDRLSAIFQKQTPSCFILDCSRVKP